MTISRLPLAVVELLRQRCGTTHGGGWHEAFLNHLGFGFHGFGYSTFDAGCLEDEAQVRQQISEGCKACSNLNISASSPTVEKEFQDLTNLVDQNAPADQMEAKVEALDKDLVVIKEAFTKANEFYDKAIAAPGAPEWSQYAAKLKKANELVVEIDDKTLSGMHKYISALENGLTPDNKATLIQTASELHDAYTEYGTLVQQVQQFAANHDIK